MRKKFTQSPQLGWEWQNPSGGDSLSAKFERWCRHLWIVYQVMVKKMNILCDCYLVYIPYTLDRSTGPRPPKRQELKKKNDTHQPVMVKQKNKSENKNLNQSKTQIPWLHNSLNRIPLPFPSRVSTTWRTTTQIVTWSLSYSNELDQQLHRSKSCSRLQAYANPSHHQTNGKPK